MNRVSIACPVMHGNEKKYINECVDTGWISANGAFVTRFEQEFAEFCNTKYAIACSNGTVSLHLCLLGLGIGPGDEVIMPTLTYIATANCVSYCGATPVFVDSDIDTFNIDVDKIEEKITSRTKAIMPVHLYGLSCDMEKIRELANKYGLFVIEDAAEAHGAKFRGSAVGSLGDVASFSFFGNKIITCGEGGMAVTNNKTIYEKMKLYRGQGVDPKKSYWHTVIGYNYRMTNMQAALGVAQLEKIEWHLEQRQRVAELYKRYLEAYSDILRMQKVPLGYQHVYWMNNVVLQDGVKLERDLVMKKMEEQNIEMRPVFYPMHQMPPYYSETASYPIAEKISSRGISLPSHAMLTESDVGRVCQTLIEICKEQA